MPGIEFNLGEPTAKLRRFPLFLVNDADGATPENGEVGGQPQISINNESFSNTAETLAFLANGAYYVELSTTELNELGQIRIRYKSANTREFQLVAMVKTPAITSIDDLQALTLSIKRKTNVIEQKMVNRENAAIQDIDPEGLL